jgi:hypothetical protein
LDKKISQRECYNLTKVASLMLLRKTTAKKAGLNFFSYHDGDELFPELHIGVPAAVVGVHDGVLHIRVGEAQAVPYTIMFNDQHCGFGITKIYFVILLFEKSVTRTFRLSCTLKNFAVFLAVYRKRNLSVISEHDQEHGTKMLTK